MKNKKLLFVLVLVLLLTSCMSIRVDFGNGVSMSLMNVSDEMYGYVDEYQLITGSFPYLGDNMSFESWTCIDDVGIHLVAFLPTGQTFAKIDWDGKKLSYDSGFMPQGKFFAQYIVSDLQLCYGNYSNIYADFYKAGLQLTELTVFGRTVRTLKNGAEIVEQVTIEPGIITVENMAVGYKYQIETL